MNTAPKRCARGRSGFTLVEVLVVVVIIGLLAAILVPNVIGRIDDAKVARAKSDVSALNTAVKLFRADTGRYPTQEEGLRALIEKPSDVENWKGYLEGRRDAPKDPWGNPYYYFPDPTGTPPYEIVCYGADRRPGGSDGNADISSADMQD